MVEESNTTIGDYMELDDEHKGQTDEERIKQLEYKSSYYEALSSDLSEVVTFAQKLIVETRLRLTIVKFLEFYLKKIEKYGDYNLTSSDEMKQNFKKFREQLEKIRKSK